jgi:hypothetical protein
MPAALPKFRIGQVVNGFRILSVSGEGKLRLRQTKYRVKALACGCIVESVGHYGLLNRLPRLQPGVCKPCLMVLSHNGIFGHGHRGAQLEILARMEANGADTSAYPLHPAPEEAPRPAAAPTSPQGRLMRQWGLTA